MKTRLKSLDTVLALLFSTTQCSFFLLSSVAISERVVKETQGLDSVGRIYQTTENDNLFQKGTLVILVMGQIVR